MLQTNCRLFKLSGELRNEVYRHLFRLQNPSATEIYLCSKDPRAATKNSFATKHNGVDLALLATCRLIYHEATRICYSINRIGMDQGTMFRLENELDSARLESIRHVRMHIDSPCSLILSCMNINRCMPGIETVDLVFDYGFDPNHDWMKYSPSRIYGILANIFHYISRRVRQLGYLSKIKLTVDLRLTCPTMRDVP
ncbi:hypothetical protein BST61_g7699 [Cercospora zeina]